MIKIKPSPTADTRTCDVTTVTKDRLRASSLRHIDDLQAALWFLSGVLLSAGKKHDADKITYLDWFYEDFKTGFQQTGWWDQHRKINRHHLNKTDGIPADVNLLDVVEYIADCVMAGMARSGSVYELQIDPDVLMRAFRNTVELLKAEVVVEQSPTPAKEE